MALVSFLVSGRREDKKQCMICSLFEHQESAYMGNCSYALGNVYWSDIFTLILIQFDYGFLYATMHLQSMRPPFVLQVICN